MSVDAEAGTGAALWAAVWLPPAEVGVRGTVVLLPGRGEPASAYSRFGSRLAVDGYRVVAASAQQLASQDLLRGAIRSEPAADPLVVIGADSGAATALALGPTAVLDGIAGVIVAGLAVPGAVVASRSWDEELEARTACPVHRRRLSEDAGVVRGALWSGPADPWSSAETSPETRPDPQVPVLALHGELDVVSPLPAARAVLDRLARARLMVVAGGRHDVLNDVHHRSVAAEIVQFLERLRLSADAAPILESTVGR